MEAVMAEKPVSGDAEQRARQTRVSREQSGLPPEDEGQQSSGKGATRAPDGAHSESNRARPDRQAGE